MIKVKQLKFKYSENKTYALNGINLQVNQGEYVAIVGHNGSGKSTLSKTLVGLYKPTEGQIWIDNILMSKKTLSAIRPKVGMVFQNPENQFIGATVEDDIAFGLENKQMSRDEMQLAVRKFAQKVNMLDHLDKEPQSLSGGQKQRVAIASTLALDPKIIIFDEVTSMLDPKGKDEVLTIIKELKKDPHKTLISITHDMDEAILADKLVVFSQGEVIAVGDPAAILADKNILRQAKIDSPFIYRVSEMLKPSNIMPTFDYEALLGELCK